MAGVRNLSLPAAVAASGGIDAWNAKHSEVSGLTSIIDSMCKATTVDEALAEVTAIMSLGHDLWAYAYMRKLFNKNQAVYYGALLKDPVRLLPVVYTPTVGEACQKFGKLPMARRGCYLSIKDRSNIRGVLEEYANAELEKGPDGKPICECIVFSDGGRILGLGDLGTWGMGIPIGKLDLYCVCAGVNPNRSIPLIIDAGCFDAEGNTAKLSIRDSEQYTGLKQDRVVQKSKAGTIVNKAYHEENGFIEQFMNDAEALFGKGVLLQFEDFNSNDAFPLLDAMRSKFVTYNDDIQGTASVAIAGLFGAMKLKKPSTTNLREELKKETFLFHGAGSANIGSMKLLLAIGVPKSKIFVTNSRGLVWKTDADGSYRNEEQKEFAVEGKPTYNTRDLSEVIRATKATCLIGAVGRDPNCFTKPIVEAMVEVTKPHRPVIFALSNPKTQAEITAEDAYNFSGGTAIYGSGTKMEDVEFGGQLRKPAQVNNVYIFPGVSMGTVQCKAKTVPDSFFIAAAEAVANSLDVDDLKADRVLPSLTRIRNVGLKVATAVVMQAQKDGVATRPVHANQDEVEKLLRAEMWVPAGAEEYHQQALHLSPIQVAVANAIGSATAARSSARQLPVDSDLTTLLAGASKVRAMKVTVDKKRPRFIESGIVSAGPSLAKDFDRVIEIIKGSDPMGVLVRLQDDEQTMPAQSTDWVVIVYIPASVKQREKIQWQGAGDSFITNFPEKRIKAWRISEAKEVSYFAFCEVAKTVLTGTAL